MRVAVIPGDGIGPEVVNSVIQVVPVLDDLFGLDIEFTTFNWGADRWLADGVGLPEGAITMLQKDFDAIFFGALGDPRIPTTAHGREILLGLRRGLSLYVNYRPLLLPGHTIDLYRENTQGLYVGIGGRVENAGVATVAIDECVYTRDIVTKFVRYGLADATARGRTKVTLVHKANAVPNTGALWQDVFRTELAQFPQIEANEEYVDAFCYKLVRDPGTFEVVLAPNLFGDIASDVGAALMGGLGTAPSASICPESRFGLFEPVHGSAPDIAGLGIANPVGAARSLVLLLDHMGRTDAATALETCLRESMETTLTTPDLGGSGTTRAFMDSVLARLERLGSALGTTIGK
ncbi:isocitrate/isopropylmalate dehydrogenase family protein [Rhodococcus sp. HNM0563]|uniref:isocitrate/isopropylmalate family dehydrogenase n=1 Tax=Rhodococcus sp. HNM0563 TaxID=2716339 RepID=UPI00146E40C7|nr:isocitrate/isopropylmalate dehydrogenase family protein [Rhodococcus sp. HNM0563]